MEYLDLDAEQEKAREREAAEEQAGKILEQMHPKLTDELLEMYTSSSIFLRTSSTNFFAFRV